MGRFLLVRVFSGLLTVIGASIVAFFFMRMLPGDPARLIAGEYASEAAIEIQRAQLGLDDPFWQQYLTYIGDFVRGDWGFSHSRGQPVLDQFVAALPATLEIAFFAVALAFTAAVIGAAVTGWSRGGVLDGAVRASSYIGLGTAPFWLGLLVLIVFFERLQVLPGPEGRLSPGTAPPPRVTGFYLLDSLVAGQWSTWWDSLQHLILPGCTLALVIYAWLVRMMRSGVLEFVREPFALVARSKGRGRWGVVVRDVMPNALLPAVTAGGLITAELLTSTVLVETVFNWPGIGRLVTDAILQQDFAVVQAFIMVSACITVTVTVLTDLLYGVIDPRIRVRAT
ncbi:ABC transporter permease [Phytoactinopolyspora mesophila]|uniref:ABC transporter permease subunit n=1 Tax=Phytoactinopolyspora mesophila TaxID=2650750 RepID=A0A7K3M7Y3_9ACTN|nr:ABC transporter permease [Phytoactinopolyspora mesophila]NDL59374.1 ABC transporter permease subunit [Phytoactinopolyspora mesophila]